ncbi:shikimate kinase [Halarsenatibacter silvermanii]|uniref:Shikimate kinase n=1 Tax=Halarsenatibacter silvermanii TaxID=321763 RepID=A0A1G9JZP6_9FIRM|nr:shikimate kinase [Halarsenatibacter silvermanii]SDL42644.1 shikimate kinase [Halarsenatibacter silvermanii]
MKITLIGMMGSGKSTVGKIIASRINWPFYDLDDIIEEKTGHVISEIFSLGGQRVFRSWERKIVRELYEETDKAVVSSGGGAVLSPKNRKIFLRSGPVFYLAASPGELIDRMDIEDRPLLFEADDPEKELRMLLERRLPLYRMGYKIETEKFSPEKVAETIIHNLL